MKYIKLFDNYTYDDIYTLMSWVDVTQYEINKNDMSVDIYELFEMIGDYDSKIFPIKFNIIKEDFVWAETNLESLKDGPKEVYQFFVYSNELKSLEYGPKKVQGVYSFYGNPCSGDINQLKYIPLNCMLKGKVYNFETEDGEHYCYFPFSELDAFWEEQIEKEPSIFKNLVVSYGQDASSKSNQISPLLYKKYIDLDRSVKTNLWGLKK